MRFLAYGWTRRAAFLSFFLLSLALGCTEPTEVPVRNQGLTVAEEVYRMFCMRMAGDAHPEDPTGWRFVAPCEGLGSYEPDDPAAPEQQRLAALLARRPETVAALTQSFGAAGMVGVEKFADEELEDFLLELLPFYGAEKAEIIPRSTRALDAVMQRLRSDDDTTAVETRETLARIAQRVGYRSPERVLALVRPALSYPRLDSLSRTLLGLVGEGGAAHDTFLSLLNASALELAEPAEEEGAGPTTLALALKLALEPDPRFDEGRAPLWVLDRDEAGNAIARGDAAGVPPFAVVGRDDAVERDDGARALGPEGEPLYETFDVNQTALAALLRDAIPLALRNGEERSTVEKLLRSLRPMLGAELERGEPFGATELRYAGQDVEHSPLAELAHAAVTLLKFPETRELLEVLQKLLESDESSAMELIHVALALDAESDAPQYANAKLVGSSGPGSPSEFWDDLIGVGQRIVEREGLLMDVLTAAEDPLTGATGKLLARLMTYRDEIKPGSDLNAEIQHDFSQPVDRTLPDSGMNRSLWQRIISVIDAGYGAENCNKEGATLTVQQPVPTTFPNPPLVTPLICPSSTITTGTTWPRCAMIQQKNGTVTVMRSMIEKTEIKLKDAQVAACASAVGTNVDEAQERESTIEGFTTKPTPMALTRFVFAPRNKFLTDLFDPFPTRHGVPMTEFEPNGMYPLEVRDEAASVDGEPQSFLTASVPLLAAFDKYETFDDNGDPTAGYLFAELLATLHKHWPSPKEGDCTATPLEPGCSQRVSPEGKFYAAQSNLVSYEPLLVHALEQLDLIGVLQRSMAALRQVKLGERDGVQVLERFFTRMLRPDPKLAYRDGRSWSKTNTCEVEQAQGAPTCKGGRGRIIEGVAPLYLLLDALQRVDAAWVEDAERQQYWLASRSKLVDQLLTVNATGGTFALANRRSYALVMRALPWLRERIDEHVQAGDLETWVDGSDTQRGLVDRALGVLAHPLMARAVDLYDHFWADTAAGDEVASLTAYLLDEEANPEAFTGALIAAADTLKLFDRDPDLTPALRFAALAIAPDALDAVEGGDAQLDVDEGTAYRFLEVTHELAKLFAEQERSPLARLLNNAVQPMSAPMPAQLAGKSPLEVLIDVIAEVNRAAPEAPSTLPLDAVDNKSVFAQLSQFLSSEDRGLERLYQVIESRKLTDE